MKYQSIYQAVLPLIIGAALLTGCSNDDYLGGHYTTDGAGAVMGVTSANKSWTEGDHIGISSSTGSLDATTRNRDYVVQADGTTLKTGTASEFYVKGTMDILAYYPFKGTDSAEPQLLLNTYTEDGSELVDYQLAKAKQVGIANASSVALNFAPCLSTLNITIQPVSGESVSRYVLSGVYRQGRINPYTFEISPELMKNYEATGNAITSISLTVIPQTLAEGAATLTLVGKERVYNIAMPALTIEPNSTCTATVDMASGLVTYDFANNSSAWTDSGLGGSVTSTTTEN